MAVRDQPVVPVAGIRVERDIGDDADLRYCLLDGPDGAANEIFRVERLRTRLVAQGSGRVGKQGERRNAAASRASFTAWSIECRITPGMVEIGSEWSAPSQMKIGQIRSAAERAFSRTSRRAHSAFRLRRMRRGRSSRVSSR
jgi:hypothetical protein